jgi:UDP-galactopyranose mutase
MVARYFLSMNQNPIDTKSDIIIIGVGISGATLAELYASSGKRVLVVEKRDHIGGNCYDHENEDGILVSEYGAHLFHTNHQDVWEYVNRFSEWCPYEHRVLSSVDGKLVPVPVNIDTVNALFDTSIETEQEMQKWLEENTEKIENPKNSEESALRRVGKALYEKMFENYTKKQWDMWPNELEASVMDRIPVRTNHDDRYFSDTYQALPKEGYAKMFERMLDHPNITVRLGTTYEDIKNDISGFEKLFFTGPIDQFFDYKFGEKLQYRSLRFEWETHDKEIYQNNSVINYPSLDIPYTRIIEYKHFTGQKHPKTVISREYSSWEGEPYYPVPSERNRRIYAKYQSEAEKLEKEGIYFVGRLANYKYFNMDQAFKNALDLFDSLKDKK